MVLLKSQNIQSQIAVVDNVLGSNPIRDTRIWRSPEADGWATDYCYMQLLTRLIGYVHT